MLFFMSALTSVISAQVSGKAGDLDWILSTDRVLTVSGNGEMPDYSVVSTPWRQYISIIEKVIISEGVTHIGNNAFNTSNTDTYNSALESNIFEVLMPNTMKSIGERAFMNCSKLKKVEIPKNVTVIGEYAFYKCENLESAILSEGLQNINGYSFYGCKSLPTIVIPNSVESIGNWAFQYCSELESILIPESVKNMGWYVFSDCTNLESVIIQDGLTNIGFSSFQYCTNLSSINIPESVTSIENYAFEKSGLTTITIPKSVSIIGDRILGSCKNLVEINVDDTNLSYSSVDGVLYNKDMTDLIQYPAGKLNSNFTIPNGVEKIVDYAFSNSQHLTSLLIPKSVINIGSGTFYSSNLINKIIVEWEEPIKLLYNNFFAFNASMCKLMVPQGTSESYKNAYVWKDFIIEEYSVETSIKKLRNTKIDVYGSKNSIIINSEVETKVNIYSIMGINYTFNVNIGLNEFTMQKGIYIVNKEKIIVQ
ncbi:MAG: hypothetical protein BGO29_02250 [Bacteroidales bacterium 36-12]|nr:MAG: hypothetical protein BGO29_02250 [Bacteroidales bacterium 36-12]